MKKTSKKKKQVRAIPDSVLSDLRQASYLHAKGDMVEMFRQYLVKRGAECRT